MKSKSTYPLYFPLAAAIAALLATPALQAQTIVWGNTGATTAWYTNTNWTPNTASNAWLTTDVAQFANAGTATTAGINMSTAPLSIGAIEVTSARTRALTIGNSSATVGTLTLNGATVNSVGNTILHNASNSTLTLQNNETGSGKTMNIALGNATDNIVQITGTGGVTISSIISGTGSNLTLQGGGSGALTLSGANTYTGVTTVTTGTLVYQTATALGTTAGNTIVASGATAYAGVAITAGLAEAFNINGTGVGGNGALRFGGGNITNFGGAVTLSGNSRIGTDGGVTLNMTGGIVTAGHTITLAPTGTALNINTTAISGTGAVTTSGTVNFNVANTYEGGTSITGGTLSFVNGALGTIGNITVNGGALQWAAGNTEDITSRLVLQNSGNATFNTNGNAVSLGAFGSSTNSTVTKAGSGILTFTGANTYTGATNINAGTILISGSGSLGTGSALTLGGGNLDLGTSSQTVGAVSVTAPAASGATISNGSLTGTSYAASNTTGNANISANLLGTAALTKSGAGALSLSGANTYTGGSSITGGSLVFLNTAAKATTGTHAFGATTTLGLGVGGTGFFSAADVDNAFAGTMTGNLSGITVNAATNVGIDTSAGDFTYAVLGSPTKGLAKFGTNNLTLNTANTYTGATVINAGSLTLTAANNISSSSGLSLASGTTLQLRNDADTNFASLAITTPTAGVTYNFDVNNAGSSVTDKKLTLGNLTFATSTANQINVTGGNSYTLGLGTLTSPSGTGGPWAFTVNATTAAVTIAKFSTGSFGNALALQGGNAINLSNFEMGSNSTNSLTVSGSGTVVTLGTTTQTNNRTGGSVAYTLTSGTLNLTTTTSLANIRASGSANAPTFAINGGTLNNTSGSALTLAANSGVTAGSPAITIGGDFAFGTSGSTNLNNLNLGTGAITNAGNRTITFAGTGTTLTMGGIMTNGVAGNQTTTVNGAGNTLSLGGYALGNNRTNVINGTGNVNITGAITQSGGNSGLTYSGSGTLTLSALNTFTGNATVNSGTLAITSTGQLFSAATSGITTVNSGGSLSVFAWQYGINGSIGNPFFGPSTLIVNGGTITYTGVGENSGNNNGRTFAIGTNGATLNAAGTGTWFLTRNASAPLDQTTINGLTLTGASNGQYSNILAGSGGTLTKTGSGTWTLAGVNTYTGTTTVNQGTLTLSVDDALSNSSNVVIGAGTLSVDANVDDTVGTLDVTGIANINLGSAATLAFANSAAVDWTGGTLNVNGTLGATSLRFGTTSTALTPAQLAVISVNGSGLGTYILDASGYLVLGSGDATPPTLTSITDNVSGGPINIGDTVTYTVTFSEDMDAATVTTADFGNNGSAVASIGAVTETITPGVFTIPVTVTSPGTLVLRINASAVLEDVAGNDLNTTTALVDDTTITVRNAYQTWALTNAISSAPGADKDGDGVNNAIAFLLGGDVGTNDLSKLPEVTMTATDMIFTFERKRSSIDGITGCTIEVGTTLTGWPTTYTVGSNTAGSTAGVVVTENSPTGFDTITLTVPIGSDPKKFARLKANVTE